MTLTSDYGESNPKVADQRNIFQQFDSNRDGGLNRAHHHRRCSSSPSPLIDTHSLSAPTLPTSEMNMIKVSNIMGIDPKPFDPKTYVEEDIFVANESGSKKRIRLDNNIVRWRIVRNPDGTESYESNARFVRWSDGSLQLLIGNEVLDLSVQDAQHDQVHLFLRHGKVTIYAFAMSNSELYLCIYSLKQL
ncbi:protein LEO1 homolog [Camellia sinensis]|uniref:protein LEO1 homolog n=1 Tax=Camellia sinensis TaxID=4442 RepID=UPI001036226B|nr:protein LEO1 homolog [Camellia sinensis]